MIKISNSDSIIDIIKKIENSDDEEIILQFPIWNGVLHNYTSLKILKNKVKNKNLIIITNDLNAKKIWKKLWIKYSILNDKNIIKNIDLLKYNYTFWEYLLFLVRSYFNEFKNFLLNKKDKQNNRHIYNILNYHYIKNEKSRIWFFIMWLLILVMIFIFIFYFAVNKTYITITPEIIIKTRAKNFIFKENDSDTIENSNVIKLKKISKLVYIKEKFWTSWIKESENLMSKWNVKLINNLNEDLALLKNTRLETKNWLVFIIPIAITIPKAIKIEEWKIIPWTINTEVIARSYDNEWKYIWSKWNIKSWTLMTFPWLKDIWYQVYAEVIKDFSWWNDNYTKIIAKDDIKNAKIIVEEKLKINALKELKKEISLDTETNNITYEILWIDKIIKYSDLNISWYENINIWEEKENFELSWTIKITTYIFNKDLVINKLKNTIRENVIENIENINFINNQSLRLSNIIYEQNKPFEVKITAEIEVFYSHNFLGDSNNYLNILKNNISWINIDEAKKILINNPLISEAEIKTRPFFIKTISNIHNNIIFEVKD